MSWTVVYYVVPVCILTGYVVYVVPNSVHRGNSDRRPAVASPSWSNQKMNPTDVNVNLETIDLVSKDPRKLFDIWRTEAMSFSQNALPDAMSFSTVKLDGTPASRTVLLRGVDERGYKIYTDYRSGKGQELAGNPRAALVFVWLFRKDDGVIGSRQVRIEGDVEKLTRAENEDYFYKEPISAQIRTAVQAQSQVVRDNRDSLIRRAQQLQFRVQNDPSYRIPVPKTWGGYRIIPKMMEFYQGTRDALNDRIRFRCRDEQKFANNIGEFDGDNGWVYEQLEP